MAAPVHQQARALVERYGFCLVEMAEGTKRPLRHNWPTETIDTPEKAEAHWLAHPTDNMGVVLGPSHICSLDLDDLPASRALFLEFGVDVDELAKYHPTIQGNPERFRILFTVPSGMTLTRRSLNWPRRDDPTKQSVVFEFRAGDVQDVLPPSLHPDGMRYGWLNKPNGAIPELPEILRPMWLQWDVFKQNAQSMCPWTPKKLAPPRSVPKNDGESVIDAFNQAHDLATMLTQFGYKKQGNRYLSPHSSTMLPGVNILDGGQRCYIHHASDPLCSDDKNNPVACFDLFCHYEHGGDTKRAVKQAADMLGMTRRQPPRPQLATVDGSAVRDLDHKPSPEPDLPPQFSEDNLALNFTARHGHELRFVAAWGQWLRWDGKRWAPDLTLHAWDMARKVCRDAAIEAGYMQDIAKGVPGRLSSSKTRAAVESLARADRKHAATIDQWDANPWHLNTPGGIVDLTTGAMRPAIQEDYASKITAVAPGGDAPVWRSFLDSVTDGDADLQSYLARMVGYSLTGVTTEHALFFFYGSGRNGKGTFLNVLTRILNDYAKVASMETFTEAKNDRHPQELAGLMGRRLVTAQETEEGKRWAESRLKALTGGDPITARFMRQDDFTFMPQFKLIFAGNHKPTLRNVDEAMRARMNLIPFTVYVPPEKRDKRLAEKLWDEASGILQWAIDGCLEWQRVGLAAPDSVKAATDGYLEGQDVLMQFVEESCETDPVWSVGLQSLYERYKKWCDESGAWVITRAKFRESLDARGFSSEMIRKVVTIKGLRVGDPW